MTNQFYRQNEQRAARVNDLFTAIAPRYDLINDLQSFGLHRLWKRRLVQMAKVQPGETTIDLCCGTGDLALAFARQGARVVGLDFNQPMLAVAESRSQKSGSNDRQSEPAAALSSLRPASTVFIRGDALQIPFPDNSFSIVTVGYGLRNLASWEGGLREMVRVARPGGRLLVLDFGKPDLALWRRFYFTYLRLFVPVLGRIFCGNAAAYAYILESLKQYPAQRGVAAKMRELGLNNVRITNLAGGIMSINYGEKAKSK
jgi:demethylmenaquinone methyltransferase/2-methoxy-6-polyprenyl-1,4-benzoquinol methylase